MDNTKVVVGGDVKGDITSCKIENQLIKVKKNSYWSITQMNTYASYNVCSKAIINQYTIEEGTGMIGQYIVIGTILFGVLLSVIGTSIGKNSN